MAMLNNQMVYIYIYISVYIYTIYMHIWYGSKFLAPRYPKVHWSLLWPVHRTQIRAAANSYWPGSNIPGAGWEVYAAVSTGPGESKRISVVWNSRLWFETHVRCFSVHCRLSFLLLCKSPMHPFVVAKLVKSPLDGAWNLVKSPVIRVFQPQFPGSHRGPAGRRGTFGTGRHNFTPRVHGKAGKPVRAMAEAGHGDVDLNQKQ